MRNQQKNSMLMAEIDKVFLVHFKLMFMLMVEIERSTLNSTLFVKKDQELFGKLGLLKV